MSRKPDIRELARATEAAMQATSADPDLRARVEELEELVSLIPQVHAARAQRRARVEDDRVAAIAKRRDASEIRALPRYDRMRVFAVMSDVLGFAESLPDALDWLDDLPGPIADAIEIRRADIPELVEVPAVTGAGLNSVSRVALTDAALIHEIETCAELRKLGCYVQQSGSAVELFGLRLDGSYKMTPATYDLLCRADRAFASRPSRRPTRDELERDELARWAHTPRWARSPVRHLPATTVEPMRVAAPMSVEGFLELDEAARDAWTAVASDAQMRDLHREVRNHPELGWALMRAATRAHVGDE